MTRVQTCHATIGSRPIEFSQLYKLMVRGAIGSPARCPPPCVPAREMIAWPAGNEVRAVELRPDSHRLSLSARALQPCNSYPRGPNRKLPPSERNTLTLPRASALTDFCESSPCSCGGWKRMPCEAHRGIRAWAAPTRPSCGRLARSSARRKRQHAPAPAWPMPADEQQVEHFLHISRPVVVLPLPRGTTDDDAVGKKAPFGSFVNVRPCDPRHTLRLCPTDAARRRPAAPHASRVGADEVPGKWPSPAAVLRFRPAT